MEILLQNGANINEIDVRNIYVGETDDFERGRERAERERAERERANFHLEKYFIEREREQEVPRFEE